MALSAPTTNASGASVVIAPTATSVTTTILDNDTATWAVTGDTERDRGRHGELHGAHAGTLGAGETATVRLALTDIGTTIADHANFTGAVTAAIGARTDLSFDPGTGTLTYTGTGSPMANLVIHLATVDNSLVEGPEQYTVVLTSPGSTTGSAVGGTGSVTTTIIDNDTATWSIGGNRA